MSAINNQINHFPSTATFGSNSIQICFCFLCALMCLLPVYLHIPSNIEVKPLRESLSDVKWFTFCCAVSISLIVPLFLDVILDIAVMFASATSSVKMKKQKSVVKNAVGFTFLNIPERLLILVGTIMVPMVGFLPKNTANLALTYICCNNCQQNLVGGTMIISLCRYDKNYWSVRSTWISLIFFGSGLICGSFISNIYAAESTPNQVILILDSCSYFLSLVPCLIFILNSLRWLIVVYFGVKSCKRTIFWSSDAQNIADPEVMRLSDAPDHNFFPMIFVTGALFIILGFFCLLSRAPRPEDFDPISLTLNSTPYVCFLILVSILTMRMVKFEVVQGLVSFSILFYFNYLHINLENSFFAAECLTVYFIFFSMR